MSDDRQQHGTLTPPDQHAEAGDPRGATRRPLTWWDRVKFVLLLGGLWGFLYWKIVVDLRNGVTRTAGGQSKVPHLEQVKELLGLSDVAAQNFVESLSTRPLGVVAELGFEIAMNVYGWLLVLAGLEVIRQVHYAISERSSTYHRFWTQTVFGGFNERAARMNDWNRFRASRALKWLFWIAIASVVLSQIYDTHPLLGIFQAPIAVVRVLGALGIVLVYVFIVVAQFAALFWFLSRGGTDVYFPEDIKTRFVDVWGQDHVLEKVQENIIFLEDPESIEEKGGYIPTGILLWGPPGTGKTLMAEAVAGETGKPFVFVDPGAFANMFIGVGILKVKSLFRKLRKLALRYGGVIVFFDEADSLGNRGMAVAGQGGGSPGEASSPWAAGCHGAAYLSPNAAGHVLRSSISASSDGGLHGGAVSRIVAAFGGGGGGGMGTLQALLTEISGLKKPRGFFNRIVRRALGMRPKPPPNYRILIMMASNMPQALDPALLRPGRIDRIYKVGYPTKSGRIRTYEGYFAKVRHNLTPDQIEKLAVMTPYATGASIKDLVNEALISSIREERPYITWQDVIKARLLKSLGPPEDVEYIERERHAVALHEACHAVVAYRVRRHLMIDIATIEKGQDYLGMVASIPMEEQFTQWRSEYDADLMVSLAAIVGEKMFFGDDNSSGVGGDLYSATTVALLMEGYWGMGVSYGSQGASKPAMAPSFNDVSRNLLESELGRRVEQKLEEIGEETRAILEQNRAEVLAVSHALEEHKTLTGDDVIAVIEGTIGPLVDGRPYRSPAFQRAAEEYHEKAVRAHQEHARVDLPLPSVTELVSGGASRHSSAVDPRGRTSGNASGD